MIYQINKKKREVEIQTNFSCALHFWYPSSIEELDNLLEEFFKKSRSVMDDVSGLADESKRFASF